MKTKSCVIAVWLDAVRYKDLEELNYIKSLGIKKLVTPAHYLLEYTFFTGKNPIDHNIMFETISTSDNYTLKFTKNKTLNKGIWLFNNLKRWKEGKTRLVMQSNIPPQFKKYLGSSVEKQFLDYNATNFEGLPDILNKNKIKFEMFDWPTKSTNKGIKLDFTTTNDDEKKIQHFIDRIRLGKSHFYFIHIWGLDKIQHKGQMTQEARKRLRSESSALSKIPPKELC